MNRNSLIILTLTLATTSLFSCKRTQSCECKTTWETYNTGSTVTHEEIVAYPVKGTKKENKTQCDIIKTNQQNATEYAVNCSVKK